VVDWGQLQRWRLHEDRLPPNTEVLFRPLPAWQRYRSQIVAALALFIVESLLIALLLHERVGRHRAQHALEQVRRQVERMGRVATLNGLATAVAHELQQPLAAIRMNAEAGALLLARTPPDVDEAHLVLQEIARDDARAANVIDHYRALLRRQVPISTSVDLNAMCRDTAKLVEPEATGRRARLELQLDPAVPLVRGDPVELQQVLMNLTLNALEALPESAPTRVIGIRTARNKGDVEVHVTDTGRGLSADVHPRLFEPFFSTKPHGLGMGVTIVRSIVERHHGSLRAENRSEGGAEFIVTLPAAAASSSSTVNR
jgi:C4-dicarboxylate-specific signal transduction histidine kinase